MRYLVEIDCLRKCSVKEGIGDEIIGKDRNNTAMLIGIDCV